MSHVFRLVLVFGVFFLLMGLVWAWGRLVHKGAERPLSRLHWAWFLVFGLAGGLSYYLWHLTLTPGREVIIQTLGLIVGVPIFGLLSRAILGNTPLAGPGVTIGLLYGMGSGAALLEAVMGVFGWS